MVGTLNTGDVESENDENGKTNLLRDVWTVCDIVYSTLGPFGANKLVITEDGSVTVTSDGGAVVETIDVENPALSMLQTAAGDFRDRHNDGSATVVTLVGALLKEAAYLSDIGCRPTTIERGYHEAMSVADEALGRRARSVEAIGIESVAESALTATRSPRTRATIADYLVSAVDAVRAESANDATVARDVKVLARVGGAEAGTELLRGLFLDTDPVTPAMPRSVGDAGVAVLTGNIDVPSLASEGAKSDLGDAHMDVESLDEREALRERELRMFREDMEAALDAGCRFVMTEGAVNERVETMLANRGVLAVANVDHADAGRVARVTDATVVPSLGEVTTGTLGRATVGVQRYAGRDLIAVEADAHPVFTLLCRAPDPRSVKALHRSVEAALQAASVAREEGRVVPGGGAAEVSAAHAVREHARGVSGREQLAVEAFANALYAVPRALARNGGLDGWKGLVQLNVAHSEGRDAVGVDSIIGETRDVLDPEDPIVEPLLLKRAVWSAATDLTIRFVRIDDQLPASNLGDSEDAADAADADDNQHDRP